MKSILIGFRILISILILNFFAGKISAQWQQMSAGITGGVNVTSFATGGSSIFAGTLGEGIYQTSNEGVSWSTVNNGLTNLSVYSLGMSGNNIFAGTYSAGVFLSTNNGALWISSNSGIEGNIFSFAVSGTSIYAAGNGGVFLSINNGASWTELLNGLPNSFSSTAVCISGTYVFAAENTTGTGGIYRSSDGGSNWTAAINGLGTGSVHALGASGTNIFAGTSSGIYMSANQGNNWSPVNNGLPGLMYINTFGVSGTNVFTGTNPSGGIYLTTNNGANWIDKNLGFSGPAYVYAITFAGNYIFAAKYHSVWRRAYSDIIGIKNLSSEIPGEYSLEQNYPNPFNPETKIIYKIKKSSFVSLRVYNSLGREVESFVNIVQAPGTYEVTFDGKNYSSGTYFYKLDSKEYTETRRMVLIK